MSGLLVISTTFKRVVQMHTDMFLRPPFEVEGEIVGGGSGFLFVTDIVVVAEERAQTLHSRTLAPPPHVEPITDKRVQASRLHQIDGVSGHRVEIGNTCGALQILATGGPMFTQVFRAARPTVAGRVPVLEKRIVAQINRS